MEEIIDSQRNLLGIDEFLEQAQKYTQNVFPDLDINQLFTESIKSGNIGNIFFSDSIGKMFFEEISVAIEVMISVLIIIIIHSVFKAIMESLGNSTSKQIVYFVQYLIIVTLVINSFVSVLDLTKESIGNITNFMGLLIPLLTTLMLTTGTITTSTVIEPILLIMVNFIGIFINSFLIPLLLISISISIVSNISDKIQIGKLSKFLKSSIVWVLGIVLTIFATTLSLNGNLTSTVDRNDSKNCKSSSFQFYSSSWKNNGRYSR